MSLLCVIGYQFSNLIFDHCQIPYADLSMTTFYNCSFRNTNISQAKMYKSGFYLCAVDSIMMDNVNLGIKKFDVEFTPMCCAISHDNKQIAVGCGNYLILLHGETGK